MSKPIGTPFSELFAELEQDPKFRAAYRQSKPYYDILVNVIRQRHKLGLSQADLAKRAGLHQSNIARIESGEHNISLANLIKIAEALYTQIEINFWPIYHQNQDEYEKLFTLKADFSSQEADEFIESDAISQIFAIKQI